MKRYRVLGTGCLWLLCACGGASVAAEEPEGGATPSFMEDADDPVAAEMRRIAERMDEAGLELGPIHGGGFLTQREQHTHEVQVPPGVCATIVALSARGIRDIDSMLFSPAGDVLAEDIEPDAHPSIQVCGGDEGRRLYYGLLAYDGAGTYVYASFVGNRESFDTAARILGGRPGVVSEGTERGDQDVRLRELANGVARRGFRAHGEPIAVPLARDQRVRLPLTTERGHCYTVAALSMPGLEDVDVRILDELDRELATDHSPASDATAQLCVERDAILAVEVHAKRGEGEARVAFFQAGDASAGGSSGLWLGERNEMRVSFAPLSEAIESDLRSARARGWRDADRRARGALVPGEAVGHPIRLRRGCSLVVATGGRGIGKLLLRVVDRSGATVADPAPIGSTADARVCVEAPAEVEAQIVARRGGGDYALHVLTGRATDGIPAEAPVAVRGGLLSALEEAMDEHWTLRLGPERVAVDAEGVARVPIRPPTGRCARAHVVADAEVTTEVHHGDDLAERVHGRARSVLVCDRDDAAAPRIEIHAPPGTAPWLTILDR